MTKLALPALGALFAPWLVAAVYLTFSRWPDRWFTTESDYLALGVAILAGLIALWSIPLKPWLRAVVTIGYVLVVGASIIPFALVFVCLLFGDCL